MNLHLNRHEARELLKAIDGPSTCSLTLANVYERLKATMEKTSKKQQKLIRENHKPPEGGRLD
jgi:hypothetical protein